MNIKKTKGGAVGRSMGVMDSSPVQVEDGTIEMAGEFTYLGSSVASDGDLNREGFWVLCHIAKAARVVGCLKEPIFQSKHWSVETKRAVY